MAMAIGGGVNRAAVQAIAATAARLIASEPACRPAVWWPRSASRRGEIEEQGPG
jgi:hypothetical protein